MQNYNSKGKTQMRIVLCGFSVYWIAIILGGCGGTGIGIRTSEFPDELVHFTAYPGNPVFAGTGTKTWDCQIRERGFILREGDTWRLWYTGYACEKDEKMRVGYATSKDGLHWERWLGNPLVQDLWVEDMCVVKYKGVYYMFAESEHDIARMLTSPDGIRWTDQGSLDVLYTNGQPIAKDGPYGTPTALFENGMWHLFYERDDGGVWLAMSSDSKTWTNVQDDPVIAMGPDAYDAKAIAVDQIIKYRGRYYAYYHASAYKPWRNWTTNIAVSLDLIHWKKYPGNPITTEKQDICGGLVVHDREQFRLYTMHPTVQVHLGIALKLPSKSITR
jgi:beta-1,2-mannobiose phosphorylase / 1,2-beta-oligomannan phosphorylase